MLWKKWAVVTRDGRIQNLDGFGTGRIAVFDTKKAAKRDCDPKDERVVRVRILAAHR